MSSSLLVTGGAGYIGTHTLVELIAAGHRPTVFDNLSNSSEAAVARVAEITGQQVPLIKGDICSLQQLRSAFERARAKGDPYAGVLHLAGCKAVGESVADPVKYFRNNVSGTVNLLDAMSEAGVKRLVFSSSATVYGEPKFLPFTEAHPLAPTNPYGRTKLMVEQILQDVCIADSTFSAVTLRYFNPIGAHPSGRIGESPLSTPNNLFPFITQVAVGRQPYLKVFGCDYPTADGTGVRDYLHVSDLAVGHVRAVEYTGTHQGFIAINLGTGKGTSVLELVQAFERVNKLAIPWKVESRRAGDVEQTWANSELARNLLGWQTTRGVDAMCQDGWRWQQRNPGGY